MRQRSSKPQRLSQEVGLKNGGQFAAATIDGRWAQLPHAQLPRELGHGDGSIELPYSELPRELGHGDRRTELSSI